MGGGLLYAGGVRSINEVMAKGRAIGAQALSTLAMEMSEGQVDTPHTYIEASIHTWGVEADLPARG